MRQFSVCQRFDKPNHMWFTWKALFLAVVEKHASLRTKRVRPLRCECVTQKSSKGKH